MATTRYDETVPASRSGGAGAVARRGSYPVETKPFFLTSEFATFLVAEIALVITALASDSIDAWRFWILTTALASLYMLSRGIAKSGARSRAFDPREELELGRDLGGATAER
jgi:hypothetical protein